MSITKDQIQKVVEVEDDFGHEMRVGHALDTLTHAVSSWIRIHDPIHGETYDDPKTQKTRQFDFRSKIVCGYNQKRVLSMAVECKNLNPELPLVICGRERTDRESYHTVISANNGSPKLFKVSGPSSIYKPSDFVGKSVLRLKMKSGELCSDGDSEIYDRWTQALASSHDLAMEAIRNPPKPDSYTFIIPMVVVPDGSLWTVSYDHKGGVANEPQKVNHCEFHVTHKINVNLPVSGEFQCLITHIHFLTLGGLKSMISEFANIDFYKWDRIFSEDAREFNPAM